MEQKEFRFIDRIRYAFGSKDTRYEIAKMANLPEDILHRMTNDRDRNVREILARRKDTPDDIIRTLSTDKSHFVRRVIAERKVLPNDVIHILSADKDQEVREAIAHQDVLPEDVVRVLANDKDSDVRRVITKRKNLPEDIVRIFVKDESESIRFALAKREDLSEDVIRTLSTDESESIRTLIANREDLPGDVIRTLSTDKDWVVREAIAKHKDLPEDIVRTLAADEDKDVRHRAIDAIKQKYSETMNNSEAAFPDTGKKLWDKPPYEITELKYDNSLRHIDSIVIKNGNNIKTSFSGKAIDGNNRLNFMARDFFVKYDLASGKAEFHRAQKQAIPLPERPIERDEPVYHVKPRLVELAGGSDGTTLYDIVMNGQVKNTFNRIEDPQEGFSVVVKDGRCNYLSTKTGELLCKSWLDKTLPFKDGKAVCQVGKTGYIIDTKGIIQKRFFLETKKPGMHI